MSVLLLGLVLIAPSPPAPATAGAAVSPAPAAPPAGAAVGPKPASSAPVLRRPPAPPGLSWDDADLIERTIARVERRLRSGRPAAVETVVVTDRQLNSYLNLSLGPRIPRGIQGLTLRFDQDRLGARAMVDLDQVRQNVPALASGLLAMLSGTVPCELVGRVSSSGGSGRVEIESATLAGVSLPSSMLAQIVSLSTRSRRNPDGIDLLAPFPLPWTAQKVRLEPGRAFVDFASQPLSGHR